jgi:hypothetical protein
MNCHCYATNYTRSTERWSKFCSNVTQFVPIDEIGLSCEEMAIGVANGAKNMALTSHNFHIESNSRNILSMFSSKIQNLADLT